MGIGQRPCTSTRVSHLPSVSKAKVALTAVCAPVLVFLMVTQLPQCEPPSLSSISTSSPQDDHEDFLVGVVDGTDVVSVTVNLVSLLLLCFR